MIHGTRHSLKDAQDVRLVLQDHGRRRARPHIAGIRPMISPHDAAISLSFSVAMSELSSPLASQVVPKKPNRFGLMG